MKISEVVIGGVVYLLALFTFFGLLVALQVGAIIGPHLPLFIYFPLMLTLILIPPAFVAVKGLRFLRGKSLTTPGISVSTVGVYFLVNSVAALSIGGGFTNSGIISFVFGISLFGFGLRLHDIGWLIDSRERKRPLGIIALICITIFSDISGVISIPILTVELIRSWSILSAYTLVSIAIIVPLDIVFIIGIYRGSGWAWKWFVVLNIIGIGQGAPYLVIGHVAGFIGGAFIVGVTLLLLWSKPIRIYCGILKPPSAPSTKVV